MLAYTLGELLDRLSICNLKQWHLEELIADENTDIEEVGRLADQVVAINNLRKKIIDSINELFDKYAKGRQND